MSTSHTRSAPRATTTSSGSSFVSSGFVATALMGLYMSLSMYNLYKLMYPLTSLDVNYHPSTLVKSLWSRESTIHLKLYLSSLPDFSPHFLYASDFSSIDDGGSDNNNINTEPSSRPIPDDVALLFSEPLETPAFAHSFILTTTCPNTANQGLGNTPCNTGEDRSYQTAVSWLDQAERVESESSEGGLLAAVAAAGQGIESTSFLLTMYLNAIRNLRRVMKWFNVGSNSNATTTTADRDTEKSLQGHLQRKMVHLPPTSRIWTRITNNSTVYVHALLVRTDYGDVQWPPPTRDAVDSALRSASRAQAILLGKVNMIKYDVPNHIRKPGRILARDLLYLFQRFVLQWEHLTPPWNMVHHKPQESAQYMAAMEMKKKKVGYSYWKPEVAIKLVNEEEHYPQDAAALSGMPIARVTKSDYHPTGFAFVPVLHVDEIGLTSEKYIPVNETVTTLPLRVLFDRSDIHHASKQTTVTAGGMSPARWRLLRHLSEALETQKDFGFEEQDIDDVRRLIADTNVTLLAITLIFSALHMLFEFLTFKNEVSFWRNNKDLTGLSVRSLFLDMIGQTIILLFLIEKDSSLLMTIPSGIGCLIALWKCRRAAGLEFVKLEPGRKVSWYNSLPALVGFELRALRLEVPLQTGLNDSNTSTNNEKEAESRSHSTNLARITLEADRTATRTLGTVLLPLVVGYTLYSFIREEHTGWYSWLITSASSAVYALGFVLMTPQLFLNWKLKSVAHLPWRVLAYKFLNTFIDDLFSFIIRMPTMARISCFRDDIVFIIYLYQRWLYPVDASRPVEGGAGEQIENATSVSQDKKNQ